jgi:hypothetical protein
MLGRPPRLDWAPAADHLSANYGARHDYTVGRAPGPYNCTVPRRRSTPHGRPDQNARIRKISRHDCSRTSTFERWRPTCVWAVRGRLSRYTLTFLQTDVRRSSSQQPSPTRHGGMTVLSRRSYDDELGWVEALVLTHAVRSLSQHDLKGRIVKHSGEQQVGAGGLWGLGEDLGSHERRFVSSQLCGGWRCRSNVRSLRNSRPTLASCFSPRPDQLSANAVARSPCNHAEFTAAGSPRSAVALARRQIRKIISLRPRRSVVTPPVAFCSARSAASIANGTKVSTGHSNIHHFADISTRTGK